MVPFITIVIFAVIGWAIGGIWGVIVGAIAGYVFSLLVGHIATKVSGGLLPAKVRKTLAQEFINKYPDIVSNEHTHSMSSDEVLSFVEIQIERIAKQALMASPGYEITYEGLNEAGERAIAQEPDTTIHPMLRQLADFMLKSTPWDAKRH